MTAEFINIHSLLLSFLWPLYKTICIQIREKTVEFCSMILPAPALYLLINTIYN